MEFKINPKYQAAIYEVEQQAAKAKRFPDRLIKIGGYRNYFLFNAKAELLFQINWNEERNGRDKWDLTIDGENELIDAYPTKLMAATVARNWK